MKKLAVCCVALGSQLFAGSASADPELDIAIGSDWVAIDTYLTNERRGSQWGAGLTHNEDESATAVSAMYNVIGDVFATPEVRSGLGVKAVIHDTFQTAGSLALGGSVRYEPQIMEGVGLEGQLYYAPDVLNTNDADQYHEVLARVTYDVHERARVFAGWTDKTVKYDDAPVSEVEINNSLNLGFTLVF